MQTVTEIMIKKTMVESTSSICNYHPQRKAKPVFKIMLDGEEVCPLCATTEIEQNLSAVETERIYRSDNEKNYKVLSEKSILTDLNLRDASFKNYLPTCPEAEANKGKAITAVKKYNEGEVFNTWLTGRPGVGKSHLAMTILKNLNEVGEQNRSCLFVSVEEMLLKIRDSFNNKESKFTEHYFIDLLSNVDYLVLDDLGAETGGTNSSKVATDFTLRVLYAIANARQSKSTVITSNLTIDKLAKMYDEKLVSRLLRNTFQIKFELTKDFRTQKIEF